VVPPAGRRARAEREPADRLISKAGCGDPWPRYGERAEATAGVYDDAGRQTVANVARLEAAGLMLPAGRVAVDAAKADGRWAAAYAPPSEAEVPADLRAAIAADPAAQAMLDVLTKTNRFALIGRVNGVKRAETRTRKIAECVEMLARHETIYPQRARPADPPTS
jgi:uncharacterized protein YdeI (YjbR/CyaY-like superfamily)